MTTPIQLIGPFNAGENILSNYNGQITHLSVAAPYNHVFIIDGIEVTMNKMKILDYEIEDNTFSSLKFNQNEDSNTLVTFEIEIEEKGGTIE